MYLTRPKSSKGRSRPAVDNCLYEGDTESVQRPPVSPESPVYSGSDRHFRSQSQPIVWQASQLSQDQVLHMPHHAPAAPPQPLNKYKVLPSIGKRRSEVRPGKSLDKNLSKLHLSDDSVLQQSQRHEEPDPQTSSSEGGKKAERHLGACPEPLDPGPIVTKEASGSLLLAIRAPCGKRFQQHFEPTDTLLMVRTSAEGRYGAKYGEVSIETMDVPRRSFTDLDLTLAQCGILNKSVLCISQNDGVMEQERV
uniref:UBX domain-containing protein 10 n=1 Tax=Monopterus albus TaxID=43700 RepID=UPI0009B46C83|nr:UBX domain-containing protein 10 [Monopterus albus]